MKTAGEEYLFFAAVFLRELGKHGGEGTGAAPLRGALLARRSFLENVYSWAVRAREAFLRPHPNSRAHIAQTSREWVFHPSSEAMLLE